nr:retrotransposon protein, putative, Ty3-gypsy subclass [Tanacetum cinerariifolium]
MEDQPLPADASPTALSPGYVVDSDPEKDEKDPKEDPADYPVDKGNYDDDESSNDDDDVDDVEKDEEDKKEEEHLALADSSFVPIVDPTMIPFSHTRLRRARKTVRPEPPMSASMKACIARHAAVLTPSLPVSSPPLPLPSPLTTSPTDAGAPLGYREAEIRMRALLPPTSPRTDVPEAKMPPRKRACFTTPALGLKIKESSATEVAPTTLEGVDQRVTELDTTIRQRTEEFEVRFEEAQDDRAFLRARVNTLFRDIPFHRHTVLLLDREATYARETWAGSKDRSAAIEAHVRTLEARTLEARDPEPQDEPAKADSSWTFVIFFAIIKMAPKKRTTRATPATITTPTTTVIDAQFQALIDRGVAAALAKRDADMSRDGDNNHGSGTDRRRQVPTQRECTYIDFLKCQPMNFKGTEGVVGLTQWVEKIESVFLINNCAIASQVKQDVPYAIPWTALKRMIKDKHCPRGEIKKLDSEYWNLRVRAKVERYVGGLPDMIHGSVNASKPRSIQEAIEFATEMMDKKMLIVAERQAENKRKFEDTSRNNKTNNSHSKGIMWHGLTLLGLEIRSLIEEQNLYVTSAIITTMGHVLKSALTAKRLVIRPVTGNRAGNGNAVARAYDVGTVRTNPNSNVVTGTFLLNNCYALILFNTGADRSFVSTTFSSLIDIIPTTLDHGYDVELADGRIIWVPGAAPVARAPYRLAPSGMKDLSEQLKELSDKGFIRPSFLTIGSSSPICQKEGWIIQDVHRLPGSKQTNVFMDLMNRVCKPYLDKFVIVFIDDILIYSKNEKEHEEHRKAILELLKKEELILKNTKPMTKLTQKKVKFEWGDKQKAVFQLLKQKLCSAPILALPEGSEDFSVYCDALNKGLGAVLMQREK